MFIFGEFIILVRIMVNPEPILETVGMRREYTLDIGASIHCRAPHTHTLIHL